MTHLWFEVVVPSAKDWSPRGAAAQRPPREAVDGAHRLMERWREKIGWDWYAVGGGFSGRKARLTLDPKRLAAFRKEAEALDDREAVARMFRARFPEWTGVPLFGRDMETMEGHPDDIMALRAVPPGVRPNTIVMPRELLPRGDLLRETAKRGITEGWTVTVDGHI